MREIKVEELTLEAFDEFGTFKQMINPTTEYIGEDPIVFYRDMVIHDLGDKTTDSFSICRVSKRDLEINISEYHTNCGEGILPLDNDVLIHVAPANVNGVLPVDKMRVFRVPAHTMVSIKPGVFHHAPWTIDGKTTNILIVLPQRVYANDCVVIEHKDDEKVKIVL